MLLGFWCKAQILTDSNLPIVIINTDGGIPIPDEPKVLGNMKIIWHQDGSRNYLSDSTNAEYLNYNGRIGIETRGKTSQEYFEKKPYGLTTLQDDDISNNNVSILGMPKENDWILNSLAFDETCLRDYLSYNVANQMGQYASRTVFCEVIVNGDYRGLYLFMEKIKVDSGRVNILKMDDTCINNPEVTGGYITKCDKTDDNDPAAFQLETHYNGWNEYVDFIHCYPKPFTIEPEQHEYINNVFISLANAANQHNTSIANGFPSIIDIPSFIDFMLIGEFASNIDLYIFSTYFHKDRNGKLRAGPIWDYNIAYGSTYFDDYSQYNLWQFESYQTGAAFWYDLFYTDMFRCYLAKRWFEVTLPGQPLNYNSVNALLDQTDERITEAIGRDNQRWGNMTNHTSELDKMKTWIQNRINWMNENIGTYEGCTDVELPPLVISKIHYHPQNHLGIDGDQLEFIEITNNGNEIVDLTGIYFEKLGITYVFPNGSTIQPHEAIVLCSNSVVFNDYYNTTPFGQFTRNLSNKSHNLVLADAWGNVIDKVEYFDSEPWPEEADGDGPYLDLIDLDYDNNVAESWTLGYDLTNADELIDNRTIALYPNPTSDVIHLETTKALVKGEVFSLTKTLMLTANLTNHTIDLSHLTAGIYLLKIDFADGTSLWNKIVKK